MEFKFLWNFRNIFILKISFSAFETSSFNKNGYFLPLANILSGWGFQVLFTVYCYNHIFFSGRYILNCFPTTLSFWMFISNISSSSSPKETKSATFGRVINFSTNPLFLFSGWLLHRYLLFKCFFGHGQGITYTCNNFSFTIFFC